MTVSHQPEPRNTTLTQCMKKGLIKYLLEAKSQVEVGRYVEVGHGMPENRTRQSARSVRLKCQNDVGQTDTLGVKEADTLGVKLEDNKIESKLKYSQS